MRINKHHTAADLRQEIAELHEKLADAERRTAQTEPPEPPNVYTNGLARWTIDGDAETPFGTVVTTYGGQVQLGVWDTERQCYVAPTKGGVPHVIAFTPNEIDNLIPILAEAVKCAKEPPKK